MHLFPDSVRTEMKFQAAISTHSARFNLQIIFLQRYTKCFAFFSQIQELIARHIQVEFEKFFGEYPVTNELKLH